MKMVNPIISPKEFKQLLIDDYVYGGYLDQFAHYPKMYLENLANGEISVFMHGFFVANQLAVKQMAEAFWISENQANYVRFIDTYLTEAIKQNKTHVVVQMPSIKKEEKESELVNVPDDPARRTYVFYKKKYEVCPVCKTALQQHLRLISRENKPAKSIRVHYCNHCDLDVVSAYTVFPFESQFNIMNSRMYSGFKQQIEKEDAASQRAVSEKAKRTVAKTKLYVYDDTRKTVKIELRDFVVRRSVLRCANNGHKLKNIDAILQIITENHEIVEKIVPAAYCPDCDKYFILETTYQRIKEIGIPMCRVCDEKTYLKGLNGFNYEGWNSQSLLNEYGYNVSAQNGLTASERQFILAMLIDFGIMTKGAIMSYLDFFIRSRENDDRYSTAIWKWDTDRRFVARYREGDFEKVAVKSITRR